MTPSNTIGFKVDTEIETLLNSICQLTKTNRGLMIRTMIIDYIDKNHKQLLKGVNQ